jgi:ABC-type transport system involved in multi-copper enzyme maturation permease subunit
MIDVVRSEWTKVRSVRSTMSTVALTVILAVGLAALISNAIGGQYGQLSADEQALFDPTQQSLKACFFIAQLAIGSLGVLSITSDYQTGMIRTSLSAVPRRGRFLAAKVGVVWVSVLVVGQVAAFGAYLAGQRMLAGAGASHSDLTQPHVARAVIGAGLWLAAIGLLGVAMGFLVRSTAGAFGAVVAATLLVPLLSGGLPDWFARWWPTMAGLQATRVIPEPGMLSAWAGMGLLYAVVAALLVAAYLVFRSRDA